MGHHVCPSWVGYLLVSPLRRLVETPERILGPFVDPGMVVLEPGCGMGYFTLPVARMVGSEGRVIVVDIQSKMLDAVRRRAQKAGLADRIEMRKGEAGSLGVEDLTGQVDLAVALYVVHEVPDQAMFFAQIAKALKPSGKLLVLEPRFHVSKSAFEETVAFGETEGLAVESRFATLGRQGVLFRKRRREFV
jgi:ubiquinone/menaquinone biosynthesis C-methylase UbiE